MKVDRNNWKIEICGKLYGPTEEAEWFMSKYFDVKRRLDSAGAVYTEEIKEPGEDGAIATCLLTTKGACIGMSLFGQELVSEWHPETGLKYTAQMWLNVSADKVERSRESD